MGATGAVAAMQAAWRLRCRASRLAALAIAHYGVNIWSHTGKKDSALRRMGTEGFEPSRLLTTVLISEVTRAGRENSLT